MPITHTKVSAKADGADTSLILPSDWNASHQLPGVEELTTASTDATKVLAPDGAGGVAFRAESGSYTPTAWDDDFPGTSLNARWTNPLTSAAGQGLTLAVSGGVLTFEPATAGSSSTGLRTFGIRQNSPTGNFSVWAEVADSEAGDDARVGIFVAKTGGKAYVIGSQRQSTRLANYTGVSTYSETADWSAYDGSTDAYGLNPSSGAINPLAAYNWFGLVYNGGFLYAMVGVFLGGSVHWQLIAISASVTQPDRLGLVIWANTANVLANHQLACRHFRVTEP